MKRPRIWRGLHGLWWVRYPGLPGCLYADQPHVHVNRVPCGLHGHRRWSDAIASVVGRPDV